MKGLYLLTLGLMSSFIAFAQSPKIQFGIKGGINYATFEDDNATARPTGHNVGFHIGGLAHVHINKNLAIQPEITYSTQGAEYNSGESQIDYLNLPILAQIMVGRGFRIQTGPQLGLMLDADADYRTGNEEDIKDLRKTTDFSWSVGASYVTPTGFGADARYNYGITNINKENFDLRNRVWQVGIFYQFRK